MKQQLVFVRKKENQPMDVVMLGIVMIKNSYGIIMMPPTKFPLYSLFSTCQMIQIQKKKKMTKPTSIQNSHSQ